MLWPLFDSDHYLKVTTVWRWPLFKGDHCLMVTTIEGDQCLKMTTVWRWPLLMVTNVWRWPLFEGDHCLCLIVCDIPERSMEVTMENWRNWTVIKTVLLSNWKRHIKMLLIKCFHCIVIFILCLSLLNWYWITKMKLLSISGMSGSKCSPHIWNIWDKSLVTTYLRP